MKKYLISRRNFIACVILMLLLTLAIFFLYDIPLEPVGYVVVFVLLICGISLVFDYGKYQKRLENLLEISQNPELGMENFLSPENENEALYQEICRKLNDRRLQAENKRSAFHTELTDYYTMWVHQIKTPIAAAGLLLQEEKPDSKVLQNELFKIEQYVDMVLGYLRTEDMAADMQLEKVDLDHLIREQIHKFARIFIGKKLALDYQGVTETVLTDEKWLGFVIGQLLSNALKYTKKGKISIYMRAEEPHTLVIQDTGIGIRPEDLPRVFEKGFTGYNGREEGHSSGIGLYLCGKIMKKLDHRIWIQSEPGMGTKVMLALERKELELF